MGPILLENVGRQLGVKPI